MESVKHVRAHAARSLASLAVGAGMLLSLPAVCRSAQFDFWYAQSGKAGMVVQQLCDAFNASQSADRVQCIGQNGYESNLRQLIAAYRARRSPALAEIYDVGTNDMLLSDATVPYADLAREFGNGDVSASYLPAIRHYYGDKSGELYSAPFAVSTIVLYTNDALLRRAGIAQPPQTWEQFLRDAARLKAAGIGCPAVIDIDPWQMLEQPGAVAGEPIASLRNGAGGLNARLVFASGRHRELMNALLNGYRRGEIVEATETRVGRQSQAFASGECAMSIGSTYAWGIVQQMGRVQASISLLPNFSGVPRHSTVIGGSSLWIMKGFDRGTYRAIAKFLDFINQPANQMKLAGQTGFLLRTTGAVAAWRASAAHGNPRLRHLEVALTSLDQPTSDFSHGARLGFFTQIRMAWQQEVQRAFAGRKSMADALASAQEQGNRLLERFQRMYAKP
ncbi:MAG: extracellular solute-binding protein [Paraburkholderia sp.]|nr:MAG: extracellular solute-binding protein [Paraburkholderia sp.]